MITLQDLLEDLTYGEFSQLNIGNFIPGEHENEPDPSAYAQLCSWINRALRAIYSEFWLASEEIEIQLHEEIGTYVISTDYTVTQGTQPTLYIIDSVSAPYLGTLLKIESVYDEEGNELPLNDDDNVDEAGDPFSLYTPTYRELQVPWPNDYNTLAVQFRATHPPVKYSSGMDPTAIELKIPQALYEAVMFYVASKGFSSLGGDALGDAAQYFQMYENEVTRVRKNGLYIQTEPSNSRFENNGWC